MWYLKYLSTHDRDKGSYKEIELEATTEVEAHQNAVEKWDTCYKNFGCGPQLIYVSKLKIS